MKLNLRLTMNFIIVLIMWNFPFINFSQANVTAPQSILITDTPNSIYDNSRFPFARFIQSFKEYKNVTLVSVPWDDNIFIKTLRKEDVLLKFEVLKCLKGNQCTNSKVIGKEFSNKFIKKIVKQMFVRSTNQSIRTETFYFVFFHNISLDLINKPVMMNFDYMFFNSKKELDNWLLDTEQYGVKNLEIYLNEFMLEIQNKSSSCIKKNTPYCMIKSNNKNKINDLNKTNKLHSITSNLLLDFAYMTENQEMALFLTKLKVNSFKFPTLKSKLYAAAYYDYVDVIKYLVYEDKSINLDEVYNNSLTLLGVAVGKNSKQVVKYLIEKGLTDTGNYFNRLYIALDRDGKEINQNNDFLFNQLVNKYKNSNSVPVLLQKLIFNKVNYNMITENNINWLKKLSVKHKELYKVVFIEKDYYSREILLNCMFSSTEKNFDSLIKQGFDLCLAFDNNSRNILNMKKIQKGETWLGKNWINTKYKMYNNQCND